MSLPTSSNERSLPAVLSIAGSDSGGGAGIQADIKTFTTLGCYGTSVITALTAQNTKGVQGVHPAPPEFVRQQAQSVLEDIDIRAMKTGMLYDAENTRAVVRSLKSRYAAERMPPLVCDPVCVSTSGHQLLRPDAVQVMTEELFPLAALVTPNRQEAELFLSGHRTAQATISSLGEMIQGARELLELGSAAVLLKGGHLTAALEDLHALAAQRSDLEIVRTRMVERNMEILLVAESTDKNPQLVVDVFCEKGETRNTLFVRPRLDSRSTHGTGCTLSAAIVSYLARGHTLRAAVEKATVYTHFGIEHAFPVGAGHGPLNHMHAITPRVVPRPTAQHPHPLTRALILSNMDIWREYVEHPFVRMIGDGTLPKENFVHFLIQDYHYLKYYARAYGLLAAKASTFTQMHSAAQTIFNVVTETSTHKEYCASFGVSAEQLESARESPACTAYGAYILDTGLQGDYTKLVMALAACLLGYGEVGLWLKKEAARADTWVKTEGNPYVKWIDDYSGENYQGAVRAGLEIIERCAVEEMPSQKRYDEWRTVWEKCTRFEKGFWDMAMDPA